MSQQTTGPDNPTKIQASSSTLTPIDSPARASHSPKHVEKDAQRQEHAVGQLICTVENALNLKMLDDAGSLDLYEF